MNAPRSDVAEPRPWWIDLVQPPPLGATAVLFLNDHAFKGAGILPGAVTGKLSDFAGLFVFPVLVVACVRRAAEALRRPIGRSPALVGSTLALTALAFVAIKLSPLANRWVSALLGPIAMDVTDLVALVALVPAGLWLSRRIEPRCLAAESARGTRPARRTRALAAVFAALACAATSAPKPEIPPARRDDVAAMARVEAACAQVTAVTCRYDTARFAVRLSARKQDSRSCRVQIAGVRIEPVEKSANGALVDAPGFDLEGEDALLVGAWGRLAKPDQKYETARVWVVQEGHDGQHPTRKQTETLVPCKPGFGEDTQPPAEVAQ